MRHNNKIFVLIIAFLAPALAAAPLSALSAIEPVTYPNAKTGTRRPFFLWQDLYRERDRSRNISFLLTLQDERAGTVREFRFVPEPRFNTFYLYRLPIELGDGFYSYSVERLVDGVSSDSRYYYAFRYPLAQRFTVDTSSQNVTDALGPDNLIRYLYCEKMNLLTNGYNALFFSASSTITLGIGVLFYKVFSFGVVGNVIAAICGVSAAVGFGAAGYYTHGYLDGRRQLQRIVQLDRSASIRAGVTDAGVTTGAEFSF